MDKTDIKYPLFLWCLSFIIFVVPFWGLNYTSDWANYEYAFNNTEYSRDVLFGLLSEIFKQNGFIFRDLYRLHIIAIAVAWLSLFKILKVNPLWYSLIIITLYYVPIANQIRFYFALPLTFLGFFKLITKAKLTGVLCLMIAFLSHYSTVLIFASVVVFWLVNKFSIKTKYIYFIIANIALSGLITLSDSFDEKYHDYQNQVATTLGGIYNIFPYLLTIVLVWACNLRLMKCKALRQNLFYNYLYTISLSTSIFVLSGIQVQVLTNRLISSLVPVWGAYFLWCKYYSSEFMSLKNHYFIWSLLLIYFWRYILSPLLSLDSSLEETSLMLLSYHI